MTAVPVVVVIALLLVVLVRAEGSDGTVSFEQVGSVPSKGASGMKHIRLDGVDMMVVANFFSDGGADEPQKATIETDSIVYNLSNMMEVQRFPTKGAHGVVAHQDLLVIPNFYGPHTSVYRHQSGKGYEEVQQIPSQGAAAAEFFTKNHKIMLAVAEFYGNVIALYEFSFRHEQFVPKQKLLAPGVAALSVSITPESIYLWSACYFSQDNGGFETSSLVFRQREDDDTFVSFTSLSTTGAHDVETVVLDDGRLFAFYANDKNNQGEIKLESELFELVDDDNVVSRGTIFTFGAHGAKFFTDSTKKHHYLAVANFGSRDTRELSQTSMVYAFDPSTDDRTKMLTPLRSLPSTGATDFEAFEWGEKICLAVSNEQDPELGSDISSTIWHLLENSRDEVDEL